MPNLYLSGSAVPTEFEPSSRRAPKSRRANDMPHRPVKLHVLRVVRAHCRYPMGRRLCESRDEISRSAVLARHHMMRRCPVRMLRPCASVLVVCPCCLELGDLKLRARRASAAPEAASCFPYGEESTAASCFPCEEGSTRVPLRSRSRFRSSCHGDRGAHSWVVAVDLWRCRGRCAR